MFRRLPQELEGHLDDISLVLQRMMRLQLGRMVPIHGRQQLVLSCVKS
jgi:hypothetical protein